VVVILSCFCSLKSVTAIQGTFSSDGRLPDMEAAAEMSCIDELCICTICNDGIVATVNTINNPEEKRRKPTRILASPRKHIFQFTQVLETTSSSTTTDTTTSIAVILTGLPSDCQYLLNYLRKSHEEYRRNYAKSPPLTYLAEEVSSLLHDYSIAKHIRPLSVQLILAAQANKNHEVAVPSSGDNNNQVIQMDSYGGYKQAISSAVILPDYLRSSVKHEPITVEENEDEDEETGRARNLLLEIHNEKWNELSCEEAINRMKEITKKVLGSSTHSAILNDEVCEQLIMRSRQ